MDTKVLLETISMALSKSLTDVSVEQLNEDGTIRTLKVISASFDGRTESVRSDLVFDILESEIPFILNQFDITFILLTKTESSLFTDYTKLNSTQPIHNDKAAASEL